MRYHHPTHSGKEVAMYCATKLGDVIKSTASYAKGDMSLALKEAFMKCDELVLKPETVQEMKKLANLESQTDRCVYVHAFVEGSLM